MSRFAKTVIGAAIALCVVVLCFNVVLFVNYLDREDGLQAWNVYQGQTDTYTVRINESLRDGVWTRLVHLDPINGYEEPVPDPFAITGHDYDNDQRFDRVFIRGLPSNGYNSVVFTGDGEREWDPCPAEADMVEPFTDVQVASAQSQLHSAMVEFYNEGHLVSTLESFRAEHDL